MSVHCWCWKDGDPCCWCLDDTEDEGGKPTPPCSRAHNVACLADLREQVRMAEDQLRYAEDDKRTRLEQEEAQ